MARSVKAFLQSFGLALLTSACGGLEPSVEIGGGLERFEPLVSGDALEVVAGIQGGYHVNASLRAVGIDPGKAELHSEDNPVVDFDVFLAGDRIDDSPALPFGLREAEGGAYERVGRRIILRNDAVEPYEAFGDQPLTLRVRIVDASGSEAEASIDVTTRIFVND